MSTQNPIDNQYQAMEARLLQLESTLRRFKWSAVIVVLASCGLGAAAAVKEPAKDTYVEKLRVGTLGVKQLVVSDAVVVGQGKNLTSIVPGAIVVVDKESDSTISLFSGKVSISDKDNTHAMTARSSVLASHDRRKQREYLALVEKEKRTKLSEAENKRAEQLGLGFQKYAVLLSVDEGGHGRIDIYNPFEKRVAGIQCDKTNKGAIYLSDVNGKLKKAYTAD